VFFLAACQEQQAALLQPLPQVTESQPVVREVIEWDEYTGHLEAVDTVDVRARVSGYLQSVHFTDGAMVKKGTLLFVIDPRPYQAALDRAKAALEQALARLEGTQKGLNRAQQLVKSRAISQEEVDTRSADQREAQEATQAARVAVKAARLNVEFTQVKAPISGRISRQFVTEGNLRQSARPEHRHHDQPGALLQPRPGAGSMPLCAHPFTGERQVRGSTDSGRGHWQRSNAALYPGSQ
jgi:multidrug efflux pump subunit AcrA (membrane-fusion protein)